MPRLARLLSATALLTMIAAAPPRAEPWRDTTLPAATRAALLVKAMTPAEKLSLLHGYFPPLATGKPDAPTDMIPSAGEVPGIPRLGIPELRESDASLGVANQVEQRKGDVATALPAGLATAASFDPAIAYAGGAMIGAEARAKTFDVLLAGGVDLTRDPWGGRDFEYFGEDPLLSGIMAGEAVRGVQSNHIVSTVKHYALNSQETGRSILDAHIAPAALRESGLLAFQIAIERGHPGSVMCAYNLVNTVYACENRFLLTDVLRRDWKYPGWVMSDWGAVHSTAKAANAGLDQDSGQELDDKLYFAHLDKAMAAGKVTPARIDTMVTRVLTGMIATGLYDHPPETAPQPIDYDAHAEVAQRDAEEGMVLLKNAGLLPIAPGVHHIVLIGGHADVGVLSGGGSSQVRSVGGVPVEIPLTSGAAASFARITYHNSSPLKALRAALPNAQIDYVDGSDPAAAAAAANGADLAIVFATEWRTEAEDVTSLSLPDQQDALINAVAAASAHTAVVLETGGPVLMPWLSRVGAVVEAWYPGQRGGPALADLLTGRVDFTGHLPMTFPASADQAPRPEPVNLAALQSAAMTGASNPGDRRAAAPKPFVVDYREGSNVGYRWYEAQGLTPLFPFGYGLSYATVDYSNLKLGTSANPSATVTITNRSDRATAAVPQLYVAPLSKAWPARLAAFDRVPLAPHQSRTVTLTPEPRILASWDDAAHGWRIAGGRYRFAIGRSAADRALSAEATLPAQTLAIDDSAR
jgi:beta-glucosidase